MKKKYSKKRLNYKVSSRSGSGFRDVENDRAELAKYTFMGWLGEFIRPRKTKSNIAFIETNKSPVLLTSREEESNIEDNSNNQDDDSYCDSLFDQQTVENSTIEIASKKAKKSASLKDKSDVISDSVQIDAMKTMPQFMKTRMVQPKESETEDDMFGKMIAS